MQTNTIGFVAVISEVRLSQIVTLVFTVNAAPFSIVHFHMILTQSKATIARCDFGTRIAGRRRHRSLGNRGRTRDL